MTVYLVGAGPGDPRLLTVGAAEVLARAEVVVHDRLVDPALMALAPPEAEMIDVGKRPGSEAPSRQEEINALLVSQGRAGRTVVRLKGGDPFVFGRGGEEAEALQAAGVPYEVLPGVTSAFAVPAAAGVPVTHRGLATSVTVVTGHVGDPSAPGGVDWEALARTGGTIVILMGMATRAEIAQRLVAGGLEPTTPVMVVEWGTTSRQRSLRTTLGSLHAATLGSPAVVVVGEVARLGLAVTEPEGALGGLVVAVTRPRHQAVATLAALEAAGASALAVPLTEVVAPADGGRALLEAAAQAARGRYRWVAFTSANAVEAFVKAVGDRRSLAGVGLAAVGRATAGALEAAGLACDFLPSAPDARTLAAELPVAEGERVLFPRAAAARGDLPEGLAARGVLVEEAEAYRSVNRAPRFAVPVLQAADVAAFFAPSAVEAYGALFAGGSRPPTKVACLGRSTAEAARRLGLVVAAEVPRPAPEALVEALAAARRAKSL